MNENRDSSPYLLPFPLILFFLSRFFSPEGRGHGHLPIRQLALRGKRANSERENLRRENGKLEKREPRFDGGQRDELAAEEIHFRRKKSYRNSETNDCNQEKNDRRE